MSAGASGKPDRAVAASPSSPSVSPLRASIPSASEIHILQHSLGLDQYARGEQYRNYFATGPESVDYSRCMALCERGLMIRRKPNWMGGMYTFHVTAKGKECVAEHSPPAPKLTRAQKRYREYLDADCGLSFDEWLRRGR